MKKEAAYSDLEKYIVRKFLLRVFLCFFVSFGFVVATRLLDFNLQWVNGWASYLFITSSIPQMLIYFNIPFIIFSALLLAICPFVLIEMMKASKNKVAFIIISLSSILIPLFAFFGGYIRVLRITDITAIFEISLIFIIFYIIAGWVSVKILKISKFFAFSLLVYAYYVLHLVMALIGLDYTRGFESPSRLLMYNVIVMAAILFTLLLLVGISLLMQRFRLIEKLLARLQR